MTISTKSGKTFSVLWVGVATIDGALRFGVVNSRMEDIVSAFLNGNDCETLTRNVDGIKTEYTGFTKFKGVDEYADGSIVVTMARP